MYPAYEPLDPVGISGIQVPWDRRIQAPARRVRTRGCAAPRAVGMPRALNCWAQQYSVVSECHFRVPTGWTDQGNPAAQLSVAPIEPTDEQDQDRVGVTYGSK